MKETPAYYEDGKKYQLTRRLVVKTDVIGYYIVTDYAHLHVDGWLEVFKGWAWDGASGITVDTKSTIRGSGAHDVLYKFIRNGLLPESEKENCDLSLENIMIRDKAWAWRAHAWFLGLFLGGKSATLAENKNKEHRAP